ncbi:tripartite tricarboxylate transporter substrate-binding protein [Aquincola sp. MAHUQ-54]|uniref:Tripartite tricarboxylate transporter substrate-binding protein n=1 Tax=Aquincola agrisoli TaxID=3119538 RepID=A0AAW9QI98_9BURK
MSGRPPFARSPARPVTRRQMLLASGQLLAAAPLRAAHLSDYPSHPIRLIVPMAPGGAADGVLRPLAATLSRSLGQTVFTEYWPGAGTLIGTQQVARARADGYTVGFVTSAHAIHAAMRRSQGVDLHAEVAPVSLAGYYAMGLVAHPDLAADSIDELIALALREPGALEYGSLGMGTAMHLAGELLATSAGMNWVHVPYGASSGLYRDLLGGRVRLAFATLASALPYLRAGRLKMLGLTNARRIEDFPELPTIAETVADFEVLGFFGFVAPPRTPGAIVDRLAAELSAALRAPAVKHQLAAQGAVAWGSTAGEFEAYMRAATLRYGALAKAAGLT